MVSETLMHFADAMAALADVRGRLVATVGRETALALLRESAPSLPPPWPFPWPDTDPPTPRPTPEEVLDSLANEYMGVLFGVDVYVLKNIPRLLVVGIERDL